MADKQKKSGGPDEHGDEFLPGDWQRMGTSTFSERASQQVERMLDRVRASIEGEDFLRVVWLSSALFFVVGGYWLLRSLKDPIMAGISGVEYIPQAKIASLFVVLVLVVVTVNTVMTMEAVMVPGKVKKGRRNNSRISSGSRKGDG